VLGGKLCVASVALHSAKKNENGVKCMLSRPADVQIVLRVLSKELDTSATALTAHRTGHLWRICGFLNTYTFG